MVDQVKNSRGYQTWAIPSPKISLSPQRETYYLFIMSIVHEVQQNNKKNKINKIKHKNTKKNTHTMNIHQNTLNIATALKKLH